MLNLFQKTSLPICSECLGTAAKNRQGEAEELSSCAGCGMSLHLSCVTGHHAAEFQMLIGKGNCWYCEECLSCNECGAFKDEVRYKRFRPLKSFKRNFLYVLSKCGKFFQAYLLNCLTCERCYHMLCLSPPVEKKPKTPWKCSFCLQNHNTSSSEPSKAGTSFSDSSRASINRTPSNYQLDLKERKKQLKKQR